eukprot:10167-Heterococcus_DN1.PRE.2
MSSVLQCKRPMHQLVNAVVPCAKHTQHALVHYNRAYCSRTQEKSMHQSVAQGAVTVVIRTTLAK